MIFEWITGRNLSKITKGNTKLEMMYDCNGMRTQKGIGNDVTKYYYDSSNNLIGLTYGNNTLFFYYDNNGTPTSFAHNGTMYYYVKNLQGDIVQITKQDGTVVAKYIYDVWGKILSIKDGSNNTIETTNATHLANLNPFRYRGYVYDNETGLYYLQSRYYDPITGRFLNADVYADTGNSVISTNMFAYCENNAVMKYDVTGKDAWWIQSPKSVNIFGVYQAGHTSLLIQEKPGFWWYFYWGPNSVQLLFLGTTTQKDIDKLVKRFINMSNYVFSKSRFNLSYTDNYTKSIRLSGDFYPSLRYLKNILDIAAYKNGGKCGLKFDPTCTTNPKYVNLGDKRHKYYTYKNKKFDRPFSWIVKGNKEYSTFSKNCMDMSVKALAQGSLYNKNNNKNFSKNMLSIQENYTAPNSAYDKMLKYKYSDEQNAGV